MINNATFGIAVLLGTGLGIAKLAQTLRLPSVTGFILAGLLLNDIILGINDYNPMITAVRRLQLLGADYAGRGNRVFDCGGGKEVAGWVSWREFVDLQL